MTVMACELDSQKSAPAFCGVLIDASAILFRSFFALPPMHSPANAPSHALLGFAKSLLKLLNEWKPTHMVAVMDGIESKTYRQEIYPEYKAHREKTPPELLSQLKEATNLCRALGIQVDRREDLEADDLIGAYVHQFEQDPHKTGDDRLFICSQDKDLLQLVSEQVNMIYIPKQYSVIDPQGVQEKYGIRPDQIADFLAIVGDASDNIPGIAGIGPKGASAFLQEFGTLDALYDQIKKNPAALPAKKREKLLASEQIAFVSQALTRLSTAHQVLERKDWQIDYGQFPPAWSDFCSQWGFNSCHESAKKIFKKSDKQDFISLSTNTKNDLQSDGMHFSDAPVNSSAQSFDPPATSLRSYPCPKQLLTLTSAAQITSALNAALSHATIQNQPHLDLFIINPVASGVEEVNSSSKDIKRREKFHEIAYFSPLLNGGEIQEGLPGVVLYLQGSNVLEPAIAIKSEREKPSTEVFNDAWQIDSFSLIALFFKELRIALSKKEVTLSLLSWEAKGVYCALQKIFADEFQKNGELAEAHRSAGILVNPFDFTQKDSNNVLSSEVLNPLDDQLRPDAPLEPDLFSTQFMAQHNSLEVKNTHLHSPVSRSSRGGIWDISVLVNLLFGHSDALRLSFLSQYFTLVPPKDDIFLQLGFLTALCRESAALLSKDPSLSSLYREIENPLVGVLASMQKEGVVCHKEELFAQSTSIHIELEDLKTTIQAHVGEGVNLNSPKQLATALYETLGLKPGKKTKTGFSTNAQALHDLKDQHPVIEHLLQYRMLEKLRSTYLDALVEYVQADDKIHATLDQKITSTGRLSCYEPNLQNIPIRHKIGKALRRAFLPSQNHHCLVSFDYSQIELRLLAHFSEDPTLLKAFNVQHEDVHIATAAAIHQIDPSQVSAHQRTLAKAINFGIVYGQSAFGLAKQLDISQTEAKEFIARYFSKYGAIANYLDSLKETARRCGYAQTLCGKKRYIAELKSPNKQIQAVGERMAINTPIQGSAADIIKTAMCQLLLKDANKLQTLDARLLLQIHDELLFSVDKSQTEALIDLVKEKMEQVVSLRCPLVVNVKIGNNWEEC